MPLATLMEELKILVDFLEKPVRPQVLSTTWVTAWEENLGETDEDGDVGFVGVAPGPATALLDWLAGDFADGADVVRGHVVAQLLEIQLDVLITNYRLVLFC